MLMIFSSLSVFAYEDCLITADGKLTNIKVENNQILDVFPLITVMNEKNMIIVHPLKEGLTGFTVIKDEKDKYLFTVNVTEDETSVSKNEGFTVLSLDEPPVILDCDLDLPYWGDVNKESEDKVD